MKKMKKDSLKKNANNHIYKGHEWRRKRMGQTIYLKK